MRALNSEQSKIYGGFLRAQTLFENAETEFNKYLESVDSTLEVLPLDFEREGIFV